jgi:hypothetical protein
MLTPIPIGLVAIVAISVKQEALIRVARPMVLIKTLGVFQLFLGDTQD